MAAVEIPLARAERVDRERVPRVTSDRRLFDDVCAMLASHDAIVVDERDRVLVHGDLGFHNIAVDPETSDVQGVFDYKDAAWADRSAYRT